jgi:dTDP-4-amino-4,6-dideoxygalactose transaminase
MSEPSATPPAWRVPFVQPDLPSTAALVGRLRAVLDAGQLTKGPHLAALEAEAATVTGAAHVVGVSSCTLGLALVLRGLEPLRRRAAVCPGAGACGMFRQRSAPAGPRDEVILPSFTFLAAPAAVVWAGLRPVFVDVRPDDFTVAPELVAEAVTDRTAAILACHTFGCPCDVPALEAIAARAGVPLVIDAAHGLGSAREDRQVGAGGLAEVFSLSPTKLVVAGEGGLVTTSCACLDALLRDAREYGNDGHYGSIHPGLNARLPELSAALARASLERLDEVAARRAAAVAAYRSGLEGLPGIGMQRIPAAARSSWKDFVVAIDPAFWPGGRDRLRRRLAERGIDTRAYYSPTCHRLEAYARYVAPNCRLPVSERLAETLMALPLGVHVNPAVARDIAAEIRDLLMTAAA